MYEFDELAEEMAGFIGHRAKDFFKKNGPGGWSKTERQQ